MKKPTVICHMMSSVDGRSLTDGWDRPFKKSAGELYESLAATFQGNAWVCGRVTMQEISHGEDYPKGLAKAPIARTDHFADRQASQYAVSIDPHGKVAWKTNTALKSHVIEVVAESVSDDYLAYLQSIDVSYIFGGKTDIDLAHVVDVLARELKIKTIIVEGGSHVSGAFVHADQVDEVSVLILPIVDARSEHPGSFEVDADTWTHPAYLTLKSADVQEGGAIWLRYATKPVVA